MAQALQYRRRPWPVVRGKRQKTTDTYGQRTTDNGGNYAERVDFYGSWTHICVYWHPAGISGGGVVQPTPQGVDSEGHLAFASLPFETDSGPSRISGEGGFPAGPQNRGRNLLLSPG
jgi:hypothetical protein